MKLSERMGKDIGIDPNYIEVISERNDLYARYFIDKKDGGKREILQPSQELKVLQRWLVKNIFSTFKVSRYSSAYSRGNSVKKNALKHKKSNYVLHTDIANFFPAISRKMLLNYFNKNSKKVNYLQLSKEDINLIIDICLYKGDYLVVGSVASPIISNMIMYDFDMEMQKTLLKLGDFRYTRYADDIIVSSLEYIDKKVVVVIKALMKKYGFTINKKKTYFMNKSNRRQVTGVVIDNNKNVLTVGNKRYKEMQRAIYRYLIKDDGDIAVICGYLSYIKFINNKQYLQIEKIYKKYDKENVLFH